MKIKKNLSPELLIKEYITYKINFDNIQKPKELIFLLENKKKHKFINKKKFFSLINKNILIPAIAFQSIAVNTACQSPRYVIDNVESQSLQNDQTSSTSPTDNTEYKIVDDGGVEIFNIHITTDTIEEIKKFESNNNLKSLFNKNFRKISEDYGRLRGSFRNLTIQGKKIILVNGKANTNKIKKFLKRKNINEKDIQVVIKSISKSMRKNSVAPRSAFYWKNIVVFNGDVSYYTFAHEIGHALESDFDISRRKKALRLIRYFESEDQIGFSSDGIRKSMFKEDEQEILDWFQKQDVFETKSDFNSDEEKYYLSTGYKTKLRGAGFGPKNLLDSDEVQLAYDSRRNESIAYSREMIIAIKDLISRHPIEFVENLFLKLVKVGERYKKDPEIYINDTRELWDMAQDKGEEEGYCQFLEKKYNFTEEEINVYKNDQALRTLMSVFYNKIYEGKYSISKKDALKLLNLIKGN